MENVKVKIFEKTNIADLEEALNVFMNEEIEDLNLVDIKIHVDPQVDPEWGVTAMYFAMVLYQ